MTLRQLEFFCAVHQYGSIHRAARILDVSGPSVSASLKRLEKEAGLPLYCDSANYSDLTPAGEALLKYAKKITADIQSLHTELELRRQTAFREIQFAFFLGDDLPSLIFDSFCGTHPNVPVSVEQCNALRVISGVRQGIYDVGVTTGCGLDADLDARPFGAVEFGLLLGADHPLAGQDCISPAALAGKTVFVPDFDPVVERCLLAYCRENSLDLRLHRSPCGVYARNSLIFSQNGMAVFPLGGEALSGGLTVRRLNPPFRIDEFIVWKKDRFLGEAAGQFIKFLASAFPG